MEKERNEREESGRSLQPLLSLSLSLSHSGNALTSGICNAALSLSLSLLAFGKNLRAENFLSKFLESSSSYLPVSNRFSFPYAWKPLSLSNSPFLISAPNTLIMNDLCAAETTDGRRTGHSDRLLQGQARRARTPLALSGHPSQRCWSL